MLEGVEAGIRADGRGRLDYRHVSADVGVLAGCNGSARVALPISGSDVLVSVKAELSTPESRGLGREADLKQFVDVHVEVLAAGGASAGRSASGARVSAEEVSAELAQTMQTLLNCKGVLSEEQLTVVDGGIYWLLHVDVVVLEAGGNLFDLVSLGCALALNSTVLPKLALIAVEGGGVDVELDEDALQGEPLQASGVPLCITLSILGSRFVVDSSLVEEAAATGSVLVSVNRASKIVGLNKRALGGIEPATLYAMMQAAASIAGKIFQGVDALLAKVAAELEESGLEERDARFL
eukprot:PLAT3798.1.p2 GENE.PLAT3798.1~~PLAT3798.1.p2  ORF type:complete len:326 (+),score=167.55 PLAT3798.1:95-979(+)